VVVVNFNGGDLTFQSLERLVATRWPEDRLEVVVVDNASTDGLADRVRATGWPVSIIRSEANLGFAGGCNLAMRDRAGVDFVALVNSDALVEPGWLEALVAEAGPRVGAVNPKILLSSRYRRLTVETASTSERRATRVLRVTGMTLNGDDVWPAAEAASGTLGASIVHGGRVEWTSSRAEFLFPDEHDLRDGFVSVGIEAREPRLVRLHAGAATVEVMAGRQPQWVDVPFAEPAVDIINSAGGVVVPGCFGADRGFLEPDAGQFGDTATIDTWTGCVVLLSAPYLDDVGVFDERFFLYYEDFDHAWRGRSRGWHFRYTPHTSVRHVRGASTRDHDRLFMLWNQRNRLVAIVKNAPLTQAVSLVAADLRVTAGYAVRDVVAPLRARQAPDASHVVLRLRAFASFLRLLPGSLRRRWRGKRAST
jgi:GT2 family glycosyltransferase